MKKKVIRVLKDLFFYMLGAFVFSVAVTLFITPNEISPGGITGIATLIAHITGISSGVLLFFFNIPILILGFKKFGTVFVAKTSVASFMVSFALTLCEKILTPIKTDKILATVFGGILMGLGLSLVMLKGATTGGVDILAKIINKKFRHITVGKLILIMDGAVIALSALIYKNLDSVLYSIIAIYATSRVMDIVLYGSDTGKMIYIVTTASDKICHDINVELERGVTVISARGGYTNAERPLLLCIVRRHEVSEVYNIVEKYDNSAFVAVSDAGEIIGEGFKAL